MKAYIQNLRNNLPASEVYQSGWKNFVTFLVTILAIVFTDLLIGIGIGMAVAVFLILYDNYQKPFLFEHNEDSLENGDIVITLPEDVTFLNKANIKRALHVIPNNSTVTIDAAKSINIHSDVIEIIEEFEVKAKARNIKVHIIDRNMKSMENSPNKKLEKALLDLKSEPALLN